VKPLPPRRTVDRAAADTVEADVAPETPTLSSLAAQIAEIAESQRVIITRSTPPPEPPRSSMRVAAQEGKKYGRWIVLASGVITLLAQAIAMANKPEYGPLVAALRVLLASIPGGN